MIGKGILWNIVLWVSLVGVVPVAVAEETADDIAKMLTWWDDVGSDWEKAQAFLELAGTEKEYLLADNTVKSDDEQSQ